MVRITYNIDGERFEEVVNARREKITDEMMDAVESVYVFDKGRTLEDDLAKRYIHKLQYVYMT